MSAAVVKMPRRREFEAARLSLLTSDWPTWTRPIEVELRYGLSALRHRCRHEAQNNSAVKSFLRACRTNIVGPQGIGLQSQARTARGVPSRQDRTLVESEWRAWSAAGEYDVTRQLSACDVDELLIECAARDGEALLHLVEDGSSPWGLRVQVIDPELLDHTYNEDLGSGRAVVLGVEIDASRRPLAYWLRKSPLIRHAADVSRGDRVRIPAEDIVHAYAAEWVWQVRGVPWMHTALKAIQHTDAYVEAAVVAARKGASAMGFYKQSLDADPLTDADGEARASGPGGSTSSHELVEDFEPGTAHVLPPGVEWQGWDPSFPNVDHGPFVKAMLQQFASGVGVGYNALANDWEGVSYNSLRASALAERDNWKRLQRWYIERVKARVFRRWLDVAVGIGRLPLRPGMLVDQRADQLSAVRWQPRRWDWVDPAKDIDAARSAIELNIRSASSVIRERGDDPDEVFEEIAEERRRWAELGITPQQAIDAATGPRPATDEVPDA